jgi:hypothetical protein
MFEGGQLLKKREMGKGTNEKKSEKVVEFCEEK